MSLKIYCPKCGAKHEYTLDPPNFCMGCRASLNASIKQSDASNQVFVVPEVTNAQALRPKTAKQQALEEETEDDDNDGFIPKPGVIEISVSTKRREPIQNLATGTKVKVEKRTGIGVKTKKDKQKFLEQFRREAGTMTKEDKIVRVNS